MLRAMPGHEEVWIPLVDEPIGEIVARLESADPEIARLVRSPRRLLTFRTFAYIRVGILLGQMHVEQDVPPHGAGETWVEALLRDRENLAAVEREVRAVAVEVAADESLADDDGMLTPDDDARDRFRAFAKRAFEAA